MAVEIPNVLVVDDSRSVRDSLQRTLERRGYRVLTCANGVDAIEILRREDVQVVVADLKMPRMDGLRLLTSARTFRPEVQFVIISAFGTVQKAVEAMKLGAVDFIVKPFRQEVVCAAVKKAVKRYHHQVAESRPRPPRSSSRARAGRARNSSPRPSTAGATARGGRS